MSAGKISGIDRYGPQITRYIGLGTPGVRCITCRRQGADTGYAGFSANDYRGARLPVAYHVSGGHVGPCRQGAFGPMTRPHGNGCLLSSVLGYR